MGFRNFLWLFVLASLWGPSFIFIKMAVAEIPPFTLVFGRVGIAAMVLYLILRIQGRNLPKFGPVWRHFAFMGLIHNALPFVLFSWGEIHIASALAAILNGTTPLFTIVLAHIFTDDDRMTMTKVTGMMIGFSGLLLLVVPSMLADGMHATTLGLLAVTFAAGCYGVAIVYSRKYMRGMPPLVAPTAQLTLAALYMLPLSLLIEQPYNLPMPSLKATGSLLFLAIFGTAIGFMVYYAAVEHINASNLSMVTYIIPIIGTILGVVVLGEQLNWNTYVGCTLILLGVMTVNGIFKLPRSRLLVADV
jgi:drug/metabolite transporter (DMT)-like permease